MSTTFPIEANLPCRERRMTWRVGSKSLPLPRCPLSSPRLQALNQSITTRVTRWRIRSPLEVGIRLTRTYPFVVSSRSLFRDPCLRVLATSGGKRPRSMDGDYDGEPGGGRNVPGKVWRGSSERGFALALFSEWWLPTLTDSAILYIRAQGTGLQPILGLRETSAFARKTL